VQLARSQAKTAHELAQIDERTRQANERLERLEAQGQVAIAQLSQITQLLAAREGLAVDQAREGLETRKALRAWVQSLLNDKVAAAIIGAVTAGLTGLGAYITSLLDRSNGH
jgi:CTP-dependent riboflavin kinase